MVKVMNLQVDNVQRYVYVLELEEENYYVGETRNLKNRIKKHGTNRGAKWARIYKPISKIDEIDMGICTKKEVLKKENELTISMMEKYGWEKVRGGDFCSPNELTIYKLLVKKIDKFNISFELNKPEFINERHLITIHQKTNNCVKRKIKILDDLDDHTRNKVLGSIGGIFGSKTSTYNLEELENMDIKTLHKSWSKKNKSKYTLNTTHSEQALRQFEYLKTRKLSRLRKLV